MPLAGAWVIKNNETSNHPQNSNRPPVPVGRILPCFLFAFRQHFDPNLIRPIDRFVEVGFLYDLRRVEFVNLHMSSFGTLPFRKSKDFESSLEFASANCGTWRKRKALPEV